MSKSLCFCAGFRPSRNCSWKGAELSMLSWQGKKSSLLSLSLCVVG
ncbi:hypothetical protein COLO4_33972 [Corchorus olitorius]|uniref:Uncharacterized protein n=1 Tax=Corchorus olitorius TaxID=93759 RepID=A0A1R3GPK4_9ROSI|nr:hypothetical protein COLO4_33972 [Corchorus olitorius]